MNDTGEFGGKLKILLGYVNLHIADSTLTSDFIDAVIEGSDDGTTFTKIRDLKGIYLSYQCRKIPIDWAGTPIAYKHVRLNFNSITPTCKKIAEIKFFGRVVLDSTTDITCKVKYEDNNTVATSSLLLVDYLAAKTLTLEGYGTATAGIIPKTGSSFGGYSVKFKLKLLNGASISSGNMPTNPLIRVYIQGNIVTLASGATPLALVANGANYMDLTITMPANNQKFDRNIYKLAINIQNLGNVYIDYTNYFEYQDNWSDVRTWGGEFIPNGNNETAYIKNLNVLLDSGVPDQKLELNMLVIENGKLIVEDTNWSIKVKNILVRNGELRVGTEATPFASNFDLTLVGNKNKDPHLPLFGNKVLSVMDGILDLHGVKRNPCWTQLASSIAVGATTFTVKEAVDWQPNEMIVITSSSDVMEEAEQTIIKKVTGTTIEVTKPFKYFHYGVIEQYIHSGGTLDFDMRAEVGLLTRNIKIHGDDQSDLDQYGSHIMMTTTNMNMESTNNKISFRDELIDTNMALTGRIENVEIYNAGQAFLLGRYPIHFHMAGNVLGSYVKNSVIRHSFNRAITIHGTSYGLLENNIAYDIMGHTFFIEDSIETDNVIKNNLGILTQASFTLLNTDFTPATFWITNPNNHYEGNVAAGSVNYGFWMNLPTSTTGLAQSLGMNLKPRNIPLGTFKNNHAHSNLLYGLRIFPEFNPLTKPGQPIDYNEMLADGITPNPNYNPPITAIFNGGRLYRNGTKGLETEMSGSNIFQNYLVADNVESGLMVASTIQQGPYIREQNRSDTETKSRRAIIRDCFIVGKSLNPAPYRTPLRTRGIVTPRVDNFLVSNVKFFNFGNADMFTFGDCGRCEVSSASTDSGARTIDVEKLWFDSSVPATGANKLKWNDPIKGIFRDLDGSFYGKDIFGRNSDCKTGPGYCSFTTPADCVNYVTPYYSYMPTSTTRRT